MGFGGFTVLGLEFFLVELRLLNAVQFKY